MNRRYLLSMMLYVLAPVVCALMMMGSVPWWSTWIPAAVLLPFLVSDFRAVHRGRAGIPAATVADLTDGRAESWSLGLPWPEADGTLSYPPVETPAALRRGRDKSPQDVHRRLHERRALAEAEAVRARPAHRLAARPGTGLDVSLNDPGRTWQVGGQLVTIRQIADGRWSIGTLKLPQGWLPSDWRWVMDHRPLRGMDNDRMFRLPSGRQTTPETVRIVIDLTEKRFLA